MRILLVSQMYPGPDDPDLGTFVAQLEHALRARGHEIELAVLDRRAGGKARYWTLASRAARAARTFRPDVVYAHFLVPAGLIAALSSRAPLVVTAHGQDVRNIGSVPGVRAATRYVVRRAATVVAVSDYLRRELEQRIPSARGKTEVIDSGVDLERFSLLPRRENGAEGPAFLCVGGLTERKNVVRLAERVRAPRRRHAHVRRRRAAALRARGPTRGDAARQPPSGADPGTLRLERRRVPAEPGRAVRPGATRGNGVRPAGRRDVGRRAARVRPARRRRPRRPDRRQGASPRR